MTCQIEQRKMSNYIHQRNREKDSTIHIESQKLQRDKAVKQKTAMLVISQDLMSSYTIKLY
jgi:predicted kinase